jgi:manganese oxidase
MNHDATTRMLARGDFLKLSGFGALGILAGGALAPAGWGRAKAHAAADRLVRLAATDGYIRLPGRRNTLTGELDDLYVFGFTPIPNGVSTPQALNTMKGNTCWPSPILKLPKNETVEIQLTNLGFSGRPDLDDSHTVHWHGFRNPRSVFDGTPETSIAVPPGRMFPYHFKNRDPGTYMYHCHFEDVEHVQMGMTGMIYIESDTPGQAYDNAPQTAFDREFTLLLNEVDMRPHDNLIAIQEFTWVNYKPHYFVINGRAYPDTVKLEDDASLPNQKVSSLIQANGGDKVLLRMANLGYLRHSMQLPGIPMRVVAEDAAALRGPGGMDMSYRTTSVAIAPGESRDVIFTAPAFSSAKVHTDAQGNYNKYLFRNRSGRATRNPGSRALGGMVTEVRVYQNPLPVQTRANQTFPG